MRKGKYGNPSTASGPPPFHKGGYEERGYEERRGRPGTVALYFYAIAFLLSTIALQVMGPIMPSDTNPNMFWNAFTAEIGRAHV